MTAADSVTLTIVAATDYREKDLAAACARDLAHSKHPYDVLRSDHVADHQKYFRRVTLDLGSTDAAKAPTDERLKAFQRGADDPSLASLFFQFGRYLLISSTRPDNPLPSNSQGIWGDGFDLPWKADYKSNINYQMNYWPAGPANRWSGPNRGGWFNACV